MTNFQGAPAFAPPPPRMTGETAPRGRGCAIRVSFRIPFGRTIAGRAARMETLALRCRGGWLASQEHLSIDLSHRARPGRLLPASTFVADEPIQSPVRLAELPGEQLEARGRGPGAAGRFASGRASTCRTQGSCVLSKSLATDRSCRPARSSSVIRSLTVRPAWAAPAAGELVSEVSPRFAASAACGAGFENSLEKILRSGHSASRVPRQAATELATSGFDSVFTTRPIARSSRSRDSAPERTRKGTASCSGPSGGRRGSLRLRGAREP